jgi:hypothetical protein
MRKSGFDGLRQPRQRLLHLVLHLNLRDIGVGAALEGDRYLRSPCRIGT